MGETLETQSVGMTASAAKRVATMIAQDGGSGLMLRVSVSGGGCSGFQYATASRWWSTRSPSTCWPAPRSTTWRN
jgi:hypothetical protein